MSSHSQQRALQSYRARLAARGLARFEVLALARDRALIRELARKLAEDGPEAARIREAAGKGGILAALRRSPLADLDLTREFDPGRKVEL